MTSIATLASTLLLLLLLIQGRWSAPALFALWAGGFYFAGLISEHELLASFSNPALVTLLLLLMISRVLERSPLFDRLASGIFRGRESFARLRLMLTAAGLSAFLNNTAVVAIFLNVITRQKQLAPNRFLIGLSYAAVLGGVTTLIGTSTNLVVNSFVVDSGRPPLGLFEMAWVGLPAALIGIAVHAWLPAGLSHPTTDTSNVVPDESAVRPYFLQAQVAPGSALCGRSIADNGLRHLDGLYLLEIERSGRLISPAGPEELLQAGDNLLFTGDVQKVHILQHYSGLNVFGVRSDNLLTSNLVEVVISSESHLTGKTLRDVDFRTMFDAGVVGIRRGERRLGGQLGRIVLHTGDCLLLATGPDFFLHRNIDRHFHILGDVPHRPRMNSLQSWFVLLAFVSVIAGSSLGLFTLLQGLLALIALFMATRLLSATDMRRRFPFDLLLLIGSALALSKGLEHSGATTLMAAGVQSIFGHSNPWWALVGVYMLTLLLTEIVTNNAAAALAFPVALASAQSFGADPTPFIFIVLYGASAAFLMPAGYQTHLMVMTPGRYQVMDFVRAGLPVSIAYAAVVLTLTPIFFPLTPLSQG